MSAESGRDQAAPQAATRWKRPEGNRLAKLRLHLANIYRLVIKELRSIRSDPIMLALVAYTFTFAIYAAATGASTEATNLSVGIVDEDRSDLSRRIADGLTGPTFKPAVEIASTEIDAAMNSQRFLFVIEIPPKFQSNILAGRQASVQINVDATASAQAFNGMSYIQNVIINYVIQFTAGREGLTGAPVKMVTRAKFNPNLKDLWFTSVMQVINNLTMITVILTGAALIREREQGTVEHLLVMPVVPAEIMLSKMLAVECGPDGIRSNCIAPGDIWPGMRHFAAPGEDDGRADDANPAGWRIPPVGRIGQANDVAAAALFLAGEGSSFCTGSVLLVDGGMRAGYPPAE